mmetsp:Transcript_897/g.2551  ORF Transcript_897/g.2551 Transcript_897/m.2551 type:complete len:110 (+) Transcript_897:1747-2076(+)
MLRLLLDWRPACATLGQNMLTSCEHYRHRELVHLSMVLSCRAGSCLFSRLAQCIIEFSLRVSHDNVLEACVPCFNRGVVCNTLSHVVVLSRNTQYSLAMGLSILHYFFS